VASVRTNEVRTRVTGRDSSSLAKAGAAALRRYWRLVLVGAVPIVVIAYCSVRAHHTINRDYDALRRQFEPGMTEAQVQRKLGEPAFVFARSSGHEGCRVPGYSHDSRKISNRCLVYFGKGDSIAYVYIANDGQVEHVFVGGS